MSSDVRDVSNLHAVDELFCAPLYRPLWGSLLTIGIDVKNFVPSDKTSVSRRIAITAIKLVYLLGLCAYSAVVLFQILVTNITIVKLTFMLGVFVNSAPVLAMYLVFATRKQKFAELYWKLNVVTNLIQEHNSKGLVFCRRLLLIFLYLAAVCGIIFTVVLMTDNEDGTGNQAGKIDIVALLSSSRKNQQTNAQNSHFVEKLQKYDIKVVIFVFGEFLTWASQTVFSFNFIICANLILVNFKQLRESFERDGTNVSGVLKLLERHQLLCDVVKSFDGNFREMVAVWSFVEILKLILTIRSMDFQPLNPDWYCDREAIYVILVQLIVFIYKSVILAELNDQVKTSLATIWKTSSNVAVDKVSTIISMYCASIQLDPPVITGWRLYVLDHKIILAAFAYMVTYILVLYSIKEDDFNLTSVNYNCTCSPKYP